MEKAAVSVAAGDAGNGTNMVTATMPPGGAAGVQTTACGTGRTDVHDVMPELYVVCVSDEENETGQASDGDIEGSPRERKSSHGSKEDVDDWKPPDEELQQKIINQVEFYFCDANIIKDAFLLKHVRKNKEGFVSIKLITSFKKMKSLTKDYRNVAYSLRKSEKLRVNDEGTKVKRIEPLPDWDETTPSRTIVAMNLPLEIPSIETVSQMFSKCGEISLVRILRPGKAVPPDVRPHAASHPEIGQTMCALVEFEKAASAENAEKLMNDRSDWRSGLRVVKLAKKKEKAVKAKEQDKLKKQGSSGQALTPTEEGIAGKDDKKKRKRNKRRPGSKGSMCDGEVLSDNPQGERVPDVHLLSPHGRPRSSTSEGEGLNMSKAADIRISSPRFEARPRSRTWNARDTDSIEDTNRLRVSPCITPKSTPTTSRKNTPKSSPGVRRKGQPGNKSRECEGEATVSPSSPWVQRRLLAASSSPGVSPVCSPRLGRRQVGDTCGLLRQPKGPDGSTGFYGGIGRGKSCAGVSQ
ncbi:PREDICTED: la-related protein 6-like [Priapulus caudatus]|uniref:La-related protein 6-like n=1 Tax=Priapulus caudatus TaxID=37621 RepID=A0ABM1F6S3_PRICU|nr:PREDICTED: la-related protein 6-like [Priapulus caudatus]